MAIWMDQVLIEFGLERKNIFATVTGRGEVGILCGYSDINGKGGKALLSHRRVNLYRMIRFYPILRCMNNKSYIYIYIL